MKIEPAGSVAARHIGDVVVHDLRLRRAGVHASRSALLTSRATTCDQWDHNQSRRLNTA
jgi:hypothetical protein